MTEAAAWRGCARSRPRAAGAWSAPSTARVPSTARMITPVHRAALWDDRDIRAGAHGGQGPRARRPRRRRALAWGRHERPELLHRGRSRSARRQPAGHRHLHLRPGPGPRDGQAGHPQPAALAPGGGAARPAPPASTSSTSTPTHGYPAVAVPVPTENNALGATSTAAAWRTASGWSASCIEDTQGGGRRHLRWPCRFMSWTSSWGRTDGPGQCRGEPTRMIGPHRRACRTSGIWCWPAGTNARDGPRASASRGRARALLIDRRQAADQRSRWSAVGPVHLARYHGVRSGAA